MILSNVGQNLAQILNLDDLNPVFDVAFTGARMLEGNGAAGPASVSAKRCPFALRVHQCCSGEWAQAGARAAAGADAISAAAASAAKTEA